MLKNSPRNSAENPSLIFCLLPNDRSRFQKLGPSKNPLVMVPNKPTGAGVVAEPPCVQQPFAVRVGRERACEAQSGVLIARSPAVYGACVCGLIPEAAVPPG